MKESRVCHINYRYVIIFFKRYVVVNIIMCEIIDTVSWRP
jgi:hypothetical protein